MAREAHEIALIRWVELALGSSVRSVSFWNPRPNGPAPDKPYATVRVTAEHSDGDPDTELTPAIGDPLAPFTFKILEQTEGLLAVSFFGDAHASLMKRLETSLFDPLIRVHFDNNGIKVTRSGGTAASYSTRAFDARIEDRSERVFVWRRSIITEIEGVGNIQTMIPEGDFNL